MKYLIAVLLSFTILFATTAKVSATDSSLDVISTINLLESGDANIKYFLTVKNTSQQFVIQDFTFFLPIQLQNITAQRDNRLITINQRGNTVEMSFKNYPIQPSAKGTIQISGRVINYSNKSGSVHSIFWPKVSYDSQINDVTTYITFPDSWGKILYSNQDYVPTEKPSSLKVIGNKNILMNIGEQTNFSLDFSFDLKNTSLEKISYRIPYPSIGCNNTVVEQILNVDRGYQDSVKNQFLIIDLDPATNKQGKIKLEAEQVNCSPSESATASIEESNFLKDVKTSEEAYTKVIETFIPVESSVNWKREPIKDILARKQQAPLDYAVTLVAAYKKLGVDAKIAYGIVNIPIINKLSWHFWVFVKQENEWLQQDPFLEDLITGDFHTKVTAGRWLWGFLPEEGDLQDFGFDKIDPAKVTFHDFAPINQTEPQLRTVLISSKDISQIQPQSLTFSIFNEGSQPIIAKSINIEGQNLEISPEQQFIPPGVNQLVTVNNLVIFELKDAQSKELKGYITLNNSGEEVKQNFTTTIRLYFDQGYMVKLVLVFFIITSTVIAVIRTIGRLRQNRI